MNKTLGMLMTAILMVVPVFAQSGERAGFLLFADAGVPLKGAEGRYGANFGKTFLDLGAQLRLAGNIYLEGAFAYFPEPNPNDLYRKSSEGFELTLDAVWKIAPERGVAPFLKAGVSYAWGTYRNLYFEEYYPGIGRQSDHWLGVNGGAGVECRLGDKLFLRLGGAFTVVPNDGEGAVASWGRIFVGLGLRLN